MITVLWLWMLTWQPFTLLSSDIFSPPFLFFCSSISNPNFFLSFHLLFHNDFVPYYLLPYFVFTLTTFPMFSLLHSSSFFSSWFYSFLPFSLCIPYLLAILFFFFLCLLFSPCCVFFPPVFLGFILCLLLVPSFPVWPFPLIFFFPHLFVFFLYLLPSPLPFCMKHEIWRLSQPKLDHIILVLYFT